MTCIKTKLPKKVSAIIKNNVSIGTFLPNGNAGEIPNIVNQLIKRKITFDLKVKTGGAFLFIIPPKETIKLPRDHSGPYLPVNDKSGHSIYPTKSFEEDFLKYD
jgi:hypothetical protein